jgi:hypothetical protein
VESPPPEISGHIDRIKKWFLAHLVFSQFKENKLFQEDLVSFPFQGVGLWVVSEKHKGK